MPRQLFKFSGVREMLRGVSGVMQSFDGLLAEVQRGCAWESLPKKAEVAELAMRCGSLEVARLIALLDGLRDEDLEDDPGDMVDEYWRLRTAYGAVLAAVGAGAVPQLMMALWSDNSATRCCGARALGEIGDGVVFKVLCKRLELEDDQDALRSLIEALGQLGDERAVPLLLPFLAVPLEVQNRGWLLRITANALGRIGGEAVVEPLVGLLADGDWFVRLGAVEGLNFVEAEEAIAALVWAQADENERVRKAAGWVKPQEPCLDNPTLRAGERW